MSRQILWNPFAQTVHFNPEEIAMLRQHADDRQQVKEDNLWANPKDKRIIKRPHRENHFIGVMGEAAFAKLLHLPLDMGLYIEGQAHDFEIHGVSIEIKTLQGYLAITSLAEVSARIIALCVIDPTDPSKVSVQGWIPTSEFIESHFVDDFGYGPRMCLQPVSLYPIGALVPFCLQLKYIRTTYRDLMHEIKGLRGREITS